MKKFFLIFISFVIAYSCFAIEPTRYLTKEQLSAYSAVKEATFKIKNNSDKDVSIFICTCLKNQNATDWEGAYEYVIPANSTEEIVFTGKYNPSKNFYGFGWYCEEYGFGNGGLDWWAKREPTINKKGELTYKEDGVTKTLNVNVYPILLEQLENNNIFE